jgi:hypothetical protein
LANHYHYHIIREFTSPILERNIPHARALPHGVHL